MKNDKMRTSRPAPDIGLALLGFMVGLFSAGAGIGGGTLLVTLLVSVFKYDFKRAAGISLATIIPITLVGAAGRMMLPGELPLLSYYLLLIPACMLGSVAGAKRTGSGTSAWFGILFALFLCMAGLNMLGVVNAAGALFRALHHFAGSHALFILVPVGILIGAAAASLGVGGGILIVPFLVIVMDLGMHQAVTLSLATMLFQSLTATVVRRKSNTLDTNALRSMLVPALAGAGTGAAVSGFLPGPLLKTVFGLFLVVSAVRFGRQHVMLLLRRPAVQPG